MPIQPTYPGVYIEEIPSGVHTITGVATSITAFIGCALRGPTNTAPTINSYADFERNFGGLWLSSTMGNAVRDFYQNGGGQAIIVRLFYPTTDDLQAAADAAQTVTGATDTTSPSTPQSLAAAMRAAVDGLTSRAAKERGNLIATAAEAEASRPSTASVKQAATGAAVAIGSAIQAVVNAPDTTAPPTGASTAKAMRAVANTYTADPAKTAADLVAKAAEAVVANNSSATPDDVKKAANDAVAAINPVIQAVAAASDSSASPTPKSTAAAMRKEANKSTTDPAKTAADLVAKAAEAESTYAPSAASVKKAADDAAAQAANSAPVVKSQLSVGGLSFVAANEGSWGSNLRATIDFNVLKDVADEMGVKQTDLFNLTVQDTTPGGLTESYHNLTLVESALRVDRALAASQLVRWGGGVPPGASDLAALATALQGGQKSIGDDVTTAENTFADANKKYKNDKKANKPADVLQADQQAITTATNALGAAKAALAASDCEAITEDEFIGPGTEGNKLGLYALEQADLFNLLCIPPYTATGDVDIDLVSEAAAYCEKRRAMLLVDPPSGWVTKDIAKSQFTDAATDYVGTRSRNAALFFPRLRQPNMLRNNQVEEYVPSGVVAGVFARTDAERGVWKAPAGIDASLNGVPQLSVNLTDMENGELNPLGINCLRAFPVYGRVVWGARTLRGADQFADEYKYIPVRRTALFIEESLYRGTKWAVFEPNDEPLWAQLRLNIGVFMHDLFRKGAFQGQTPKVAYFVKCDNETTTQSDINLGIVNIVVGFAPLKPAEFVIIQIQQMTGQLEV
jgi:uncharacterized protein